ncbi:hypothetical protein [Aestuariivirga sp.]|jgi:hypothetical protein|uniref:hypothetical protein n=1 Tax=Aestuariivirga sp. TaxID=2650926 RepID=UPI003784A14C
MTIDEVVGNDRLKSELERNRKAQQALKVRKAQIKAQVAQQQLRATKAPAKP